MNRIILLALVLTGCAATRPAPLPPPEPPPLPAKIQKLAPWRPLKVAPRAALVPASAVITTNGVLVDPFVEVDPDFGTNLWVTARQAGNTELIVHWSMPLAGNSNLLAHYTCWPDAQAYFVVFPASWPAFITGENFPCTMNFAAMAQPALGTAREVKFRGYGGRKAHAPVRVVEIVGVQKAPNVRLFKKLP